MKKLNKEKMEKIRNDLEILRKSLIKYLRCSEKDVKIIDVKFDDKIYTAKICYNYLDWERSSLRKFVYTTCYFDITGEYELKGVFRYEEYFYKFSSPTDFLLHVSNEIGSLKMNKNSIGAHNGL